MVPIIEKPILDWHIDALTRVGIRDIVVIKGYREETIQTTGIKYVVNEEWATTNMVATLFCAESELTDDAIIIYGDILYEATVLQEILNAPHGMSVVVDLDWRDYWQKRFENPLDDAESLDFDDRGVIQSIGQDIVRVDDPRAQYIGMLKFNKSGIEVLKRTYHAIANGQIPLKAKNGKLKSYREMYMTDFLQMLVDAGNDLHTVPIEGKWLEIDDPYDYQLAQTMVQETENGLKITR